jgi:hypothetical protein
MKIRSVTADLFQVSGPTDRQADTHYEANVRFSQFYDRAGKFTFAILLNVPEKNICRMAGSQPDARIVLLIPGQ